MSDSEGLDDVKRGLRNSKGDPRLFLLLNLVLSVAFAWFLVWGLAFVGALTYSLRTVLAATAVVFLSTYLVTRM